MKTLKHHALIYRDEDEFLNTLVPFLREGIENGEGTVVVSTDRRADALRHALGPDAGDVLFVPGDEVYRSPISAIGAYHNVLEQFARQGRRSVRAIGEVAYGETKSQQDVWLRYESIAHHVFQDAPLYVICPYDEAALPPGLIDHARQTHPQLQAGSGSAASPTFVQPSALIPVLPDVTSVRSTGAPDLTVCVAEDDPGSARALLRATLGHILARERADEAMIAVAEVLANGLRHGAGSVTADLWVVPEAVVCAVRDEGPGVDDLFAGFRPPVEQEQGKMGLWIARQLSDELHIARDAAGPVVTLVFRP